ncbi:hypothetical protein COLO4_21631 [Corchorus olitorius]|uniref:F-box domain-containing protein n=1 Tax=Corchorus olitorius TaxID=93759 RepID=A0A1R3IS46_9ROSI|nr:hypothetical protein COLO4_21631 [Corchorus olitorius]
MKNTNTTPLLLIDELVDEILLCLPVKSLKRFKLVSKPWNSLISDPNFAQSHLNRSNTLLSQGDRANLLRLGQISITERKHHRDDEKGHRQFLSLDSMDADGSNREVVTMDLGLEYYSDEASILGSCNGLLVVSVEHDDFFLLNPSTRQYKKISPPHLDYEAMFISGLGYESTSGNYKGIIVSHYISGPSSPRSRYESIDYHVYDYKLNEWKRKEYDDFYPYCLHSDGSAVMVNGIPHWCVGRQEKVEDEESDEEYEDGESDGSEGYQFPSVTYVIVYVDLKTEKFKEVVELPTEWALTEKAEFELGVLGGWLCMSLHPQGSSTSTEVWAMKEYGIAESWTKLFVINKSSSFRPLLMRPICFTETGRNKVLMEGTEGEFIIFNLKQGLEKLLALYKCKSTVCTYVESLVSPEQYGNGAELPQFGGNPIVDSDYSDYDADEMDYDDDAYEIQYRLDHKKLLDRLVGSAYMDRLDQFGS